MVAWAVKLIGDVFTVCLGWFQCIVDALNAEGFIVAAILIVFITSLFLLPLRGRSVPVNDGLIDFTRGNIRSGRYDNGKRVISNAGYRGKFQKGNTSARLVRKSRS